MFDKEYIERTRIISKFIIDTLGHNFFANKSLLDLGCGHADIGAVFQRLGSNVSAIDARENHLIVAKKKYPGIRTQRVDLDKEWKFQSVDIILAIDICSRLKNWEPFLHNACNTANTLILETAVSDNSDPNACSSCQENKNVYDASFNGFASFPSPANIERVMVGCGMDFKVYNSNKLNSLGRKYDWVVNDDKSFGIEKRRFWIATKRKDAVAKLAYQMVGNPQYLTAGVMLQAPRPTPTPVSLPLPTVAAPTYPEPVKIDMAGQPKIAVCVSGNLRTFEKTMSSFKHFILGSLAGNADYFIHTWDTLGGKSLGHDSPLWGTKTFTKMPDINRIFNPKKIVIDNHNEPGFVAAMNAVVAQAKLSEADKDGFKNHSIRDYAAMCYTWKRSKELLEEYEKEQGIKYDIIVKLRPDLLFTKPFDIKRGKDVLCLPNVGRYYAGAVNDQFAVGMASSVKTYLSIFDHIVEYVNKRSTPLPRPEYYLQQHLKQNGVRYSEEFIRYYILRPNGTAYHPLEKP